MFRTYLLHCKGPPLMRWVERKKVAVDVAMMHQATHHHHSLNVALSVHLSLEFWKMTYYITMYYRQPQILITYVSMQIN